MHKNIPISITSYNYLIQAMPMIKVDNEQRKFQIQNYLQDMIKNGVHFNTETLNSVLSVLENCKENIDYTTSIFTKFKSLGIEPSLGTYFYLLTIFSDANGKSISI
jgi:pentatricopeptide repeat domain-containing protein 3